MTKHIVYVSTDGSCTPNPGPGGWANYMQYIVQEKDGTETLVFAKEFMGNVPESTNNRMEITAVLEALKAFKEDARTDLIIIIETDSTYVTTSIPKLDEWKSNRWIKSDGKKAANADMWEEMIGLLEHLKPRTVIFKWIKGHDKNVNNKRVDALAAYQSQIAQNQSSK